MTREELQHRTDVQSAYLEGKLIQIMYRNDYDRKWVDAPNPSFDWDHYDYRVKPELKYWRAECGGQYFYIASNMCVFSEKEIFTGLDNAHHKIGNYFETQEEAETIAEEFKQILTKHRNA